MPDENTVLTALGLDTSQFEDGMSRATGKANVFMQVLNSVDKELRAIPIIGDIYSATFGKIATGFAESRLQAREFARIMATDVRGSLSGSTQQIEEINTQLADLGRGSFARNISDFFHRFNQWRLRGKEDVNFNEQNEERQRQAEALEQRRRDLIKDIPGLIKLEGDAISENVSGSAKQSELLRIELETRQKIVAIQAESFALFGPDQEAKRLAFVKEQSEEYRRQGDLRKDASARRFQLQKVDNEQSVVQSGLAARGDTRAAANEAVHAAEQRQGILEKTNSEEKAAADAALLVAKNQAIEAEAEYLLKRHQLEIETTLMELRVSGQTRAANQAEIQSRYETRIAEEKKRGNNELADSLKKQQDLAKLSEDIRLYKLGARGRARERLTERHEAQVKRIVESQARAHLHPSGLTSGGLTVKQKDTPQKVQLDGAQQFQEKLTTLLESINTSLGR